MMTLAEFVADGTPKARAHFNNQSARLKAALAAEKKYANAMLRAGTRFRAGMAALRLHPLTREELMEWAADIKLSHEKMEAELARLEMGEVSVSLRMAYDLYCAGNNAAESPQIEHTKTA